MTALRISLFSLLATASVVANADPVEYRFTGQVSGRIGSFFASQEFTNAPFQLSIFSDTNSASYFGKIAGAGSAYINNSTNSVLSVYGLGSTSSIDTQIYSLPGIGTIGFGWNGKVFPLNSDTPASTRIEFVGNEIALNSNYSRFSSVVEPTNVYLKTPLKNPPDRLPEYTTSIYFDGIGPLVLKDFAMVQYSVTPVPEPSQLALLFAGLGVIGVIQLRRRSVAS